MSSVKRRRADDLVRRCYAGLDTTPARLEVLRRLRGLFTIDAAFFATVDPQSLLFTSAVSEEPLVEAAEQFLENELLSSDVNRFADLAVADDPVSSLDWATGGDRGSSHRFTEIIAPLNLGDELRVALRSGGRCWGVLCLHRSASPLGFTEGEIAEIRRLAPHIATGLRIAHLHSGETVPPDRGTEPGILVLGSDLTVESMTPAAQWWLSQVADVDWPSPESLPLAVRAIARRAHLAPEDAPASSRALVRTREGGWALIHASVLRGRGADRTAVVLESAQALDRASALVAAHSLTPSQERVTHLVLQGRSTREIVDALHISQHTVQEHLKAAFDKFGVRSRRELVAQVLSDQRQSPPPPL